MKVFDLLVLIALLITAYGGFNNGFIQTIFKTIGYIAGGVAMLGWIALAVLWPRGSIPQRMTVIAIVALGVEYGRQVWVLAG